jgi:hypothetical protein
MSSHGSPPSLPPPASVVGEALPTLVEALGQRVQLGTGSGPLWGFGAVAMILVAMVVAFASGSCSALLTRLTASSPPVAPAVSASAKPVPVATETVASATAPALEPGPNAADDSDVAALEARPAAERSVADVLAIANGKARAKRRALDELGAKARNDESYAASGELAAKLRAALADADSAREALGVMAQIPSTRGPDLLYFVWSTRRKGDPLGELAESLLATKEVRSRASPELAVALDLRDADGCDAVKQAVERALERGDRRSAPALARLSSKTGCGEKKKDDCWPCLRDGDLLKNAAKAVGKRAAPKL